MTIKVTPHFECPGMPNEEEKSEFNSYVKEMMGLGFSMKLMHFSDGSVLLHRLTKEELEMLSTKHG